MRVEVSGEWKWWMENSVIFLLLPPCVVQGGDVLEKPKPLISKESRGILAQLAPLAPWSWFTMSSSSAYPSDMMSLPIISSYASTFHFFYPCTLHAPLFSLQIHPRHPNPSTPILYGYLWNPCSVSLLQPCHPVPLVGMELVIGLPRCCAPGPTTPYDSWWYKRRKEAPRLRIQLFTVAGRLMPSTVLFHCSLS